MYKVAKRTLVDLNTTKIYLLKTRANKHCIHVKIVFSINSKTEIYNWFIELVKEIEDTTTFNLEQNGLFIYSVIADNSNTIKGILKDLKRLQKGKEVNTNTTDECWLYRAIKALDLHWN